MRFIRKHGRVIPIREKEEKGSSYKKGYGTTATLAGASIVGVQAGAAIAQTGLKNTMHSMMQGLRNPRVLSKKTKIGFGVMGLGYIAGAASSANAYIRSLRAPKGHRAEEAAKHAAAAGIGAKIGAYASLPFAAHGLKEVVNTAASAMSRRKVDIKWSDIAKATTGKYQRLAAPNKKVLKLVK